MPLSPAWTNIIKLWNIRIEWNYEELNRIIRNEKEFYKTRWNYAESNHIMWNGFVLWGSEWSYVKCKEIM